MILIILNFISLGVEHTAVIVDPDTLKERAYFYEKVLLTTQEFKENGEKWKKIIEINNPLDYCRSVKKKRKYFTAQVTPSVCGAGSSVQSGDMWGGVESVREDDIVIGNINDSVYNNLTYGNGNNNNNSNNNYINNNNDDDNYNNNSSNNNNIDNDYARKSRSHDSDSNMFQRDTNIIQLSHPRKRCVSHLITPSTTSPLASSHSSYFTSKNSKFFNSSNNSKIFNNSKKFQSNNGVCGDKDQDQRDAYLQSDAYILKNIDLEEKEKVI